MIVEAVSVPSVIVSCMHCESNIILPSPPYVLLQGMSVCDTVVLYLAGGIDRGLPSLQRLPKHPGRWHPYHNTYNSQWIHHIHSAYKQIQYLHKIG